MGSADTGHERASLEYAGRNISRAGRALRDALRAVRELENVLGGERFGRLVIDQLDEQELVDFVQLARADTPPDHVLVVTVVSHPPELLEP